MKRPLVATYYPLLKCVTKIKDKKIQRKVLRQLCKEKLFKNCICEIVDNTVKENINFSDRDKKRINREAKVIRAVQKKKRNFEQTGGFLNIVVPLLATVVGELISSKLKK